jgi:hypothetical protein
MGPPSYMRYVVDRNVVIWRIPVPVMLVSKTGTPYRRVENVLRKIWVEGIGAFLHYFSDLMMMLWYNKPLASATLVAVPPGGKSAELDPNPN